MSFPRATPRRLSTGLLGLVLAFIGTPPAQSADDAGSRTSASTRALTALIGDAACDDDTQCKTVAMGAKACGGPEYYLAWSTKRTDEAALRQAAASDPTIPRGNPNRGGFSNCMVVTDPGAYCASTAGAVRDAARPQGGTCRLRAGDGGGPGRVD